MILLVKRGDLLVFVVWTLNLGFFCSKSTAFRAAVSPITRKNCFEA